MVKKIVKIFITLIVCCCLLFRQSYIKNSSEITDVSEIQITHKEILQFYTFLEDIPTGYMLVVYTDSKHRMYTMRTDIIYDYDCWVKYYNKYNKTKYILLEHDDKHIGVFLLW